MTRFVVLDSGPLGMIAHPKRNPEMALWFKSLSRSGVRFVVPEIADYEVRREMIRAGLNESVERLNLLKETL